jgi:excisionase family DNA binding protein
LKPILSPAEVADLLEVNVKTVYEAIHAGQLPAKRVGKRRFVIYRDALLHWLSSQERVSRSENR